MERSTIPNGLRVVFSVGVPFGLTLRGRFLLVLSLLLSPGIALGQRGPQGQAPPAEFVAEYQRSGNLGAWWTAFLKCAEEHPWHREVQQRMLATGLPSGEGAAQLVARNVTLSATRCEDRTLADWVFANLEWFGEREGYVIVRMGAMGDDRDQDRALAWVRRQPPEVREAAIQGMTERAFPAKKSALLRRMLEAGDVVPRRILMSQGWRVLRDPAAGSAFAHYLINHLRTARVDDPVSEALGALARSAPDSKPRLSVPSELLLELRAAGEDLQRRRGGG